MSTGNVILRPEPRELSLTVKQVARYSGGSRYRMSPDMEKKAGSVLKKAFFLIEPALVYSVHDLSQLSKEIRTGLLLPESSDQAPEMAACICTLGRELEMGASEAMKSGDGLHAVLLDAAGVGLLESLGHISLSRIRSEARKRSLYAGCRLGPGYNRVPLQAQVHLFSMVDAKAVGVSLMNSMVMIPAKSLSFFVIFYRHPIAEKDVYKCEACELTDCPYRIGSA